MPAYCTTASTFDIYTEIAHMPDTETLPTYTDGGPAAWHLIPDYMIGGLRRYIEDGIRPGSFLTALLSNDLRETFGRADEENTKAIKGWLIFLHNYAPSQCWGSPDKFSAWCKRGGLNRRVGA